MRRARTRCPSRDRRGASCAGARAARGAARTGWGHRAAASVTDVAAAAAVRPIVGEDRTRDRAAGCSWRTSKRVLRRAPQPDRRIEPLAGQHAGRCRITSRARRSYTSPPAAARLVTVPCAASARTSQRCWSMWRRASGSSGTLDPSCRGLAANESCRVKHCRGRSRAT
jgi:hypothetical protein